jgi:hypothetical protein
VQLRLDDQKVHVAAFDGLTARIGTDRMVSDPPSPNTAERNGAPAPATYPQRRFDMAPRHDFTAQKLRVVAAGGHAGGGS